MKKYKLVYDYMGMPYLLGEVKSDAKIDEAAAMELLGIDDYELCNILCTEYGMRFKDINPNNVLLIDSAI